MMIALRPLIQFVVIFAIGLGVRLPVAAQSYVSRLDPPGGQRGTEVTVFVHGIHLLGNPRLETGLSIPATLITEGKNAPAANRLAFRVPIGANDPCGFRSLRVLTDDGFSNSVRFRVGAFPEGNEKSPNEELAQAQEVPVPFTVNGDIENADLDHYRFKATKGQRLVIEVEARRLGSPLDPTLYLLDERGQVLEMSEDAPGLVGDCRFEHTFDDNGIYYVRVHDALYSSAKSSIYRLNLGDYAFAEEIFPMGGRAGSQTLFEFRGGSLDEPVLQSVRLPKEAGTDTTAGLPPSLAEASLPMVVRVGDLPEVVEAARPGAQPEVPQEVHVPAVINGRIAQPGEVDRYTLPVRPGSRWRITVDANRLGSRLDSFFRVLNASGGQLATADDAGSHPDGSLDFKVPDNLDRIVVSIEDLHLRGGIGFGYRLSVQELRKGFDLRLADYRLNIPRGAKRTVAVDASRREYNGPIRFAVRGLPAGVEATFSNIGLGETRGFVTLTASKDNLIGPFDLKVLGVAKIDGQSVVARAEGVKPLVKDSEGNPLVPVPYGKIAANVGTTVPFSFTTKGLDVVPSLDWTIPVVVERSPRLKTEVVVRGVSTAGVTVVEGKIPSNKKNGGPVAQIAVDAPVGKKLPVVVHALSVLGPRRVQISSPVIWLTTVPPFELHLPSETNVHAGAEVVVKGTVKRKSPFKGVVHVKTKGMPSAVGELAVDVAGGSAALELAFTVPADLAPGDHKIEINASTKLTRGKKSATYAMPGATLLLHVAPPASAGATSPK